MIPASESFSLTATVCLHFNLTRVGKKWLAKQATHLQRAFAQNRADDDEYEYRMPLPQLIGCLWFVDGDLLHFLLEHNAVYDHAGRSIRLDSLIRFASKAPGKALIRRAGILRRFFREITPGTVGEAAYEAPLWVMISAIGDGFSHCDPTTHPFAYTAQSIGVRAAPLPPPQATVIQIGGPDGTVIWEESERAPQAEMPDGMIEAVWLNRGPFEMKV